MKRRLTKKQIAFVASVIVCAVGGVGAFFFDAITAFKDNPPELIDTSEIEQAGEIISAVKEELGEASPIGFDETAMSAIGVADTSGTIIRVVDGDTYCIDLDDVKGDEEKGTKVRIIGVDTPESVAPETYRKDNSEQGKTVSDVVKDKLQVGDVVLVEYDVQKIDSYGRILAYVYTSDGVMVQDWLLSEGLANIATYPPNVKYSEHFLGLAHNAWENKVGLWDGFFDDEPIAEN